MPITQEALECVMLGAKLRERESIIRVIKEEMELERKRGYDSYTQEKLNAYANILALIGAFK